MKKKLFIIIPISIILLCFIYKCCLFLYYRNLNTNDELSSLDISSIEVTTDKTLSNNKFKNLNIYIPNNFREIKMKNSDNYYYIPKDEEEENYTTAIFIYKSIGCYKAQIKEDKRLQTMGINKLLKKNNIKNDIDLIKYYYNKKEKSNLFTSKNNLKMNYLSDVCVDNSLFREDVNNYYLEGDLVGFGINDNKYHALTVYNGNDDIYYISIIKRNNNDDYKDKLSDEEINKIISSIYFD